MIRRRPLQQQPSGPMRTDDYQCRKTRSLSHNWESPIQLRRKALGHQFVAACLGDQDGGSGGVLLELLPQPINVRLERVSGDTGIVTPDLLQQRLARYRALTGA